jgi:hypothetical protein
MGERVPPWNIGRDMNGNTTGKDNMGRPITLQGDVIGPPPSFAPPPPIDNTKFKAPSGFYNSTTPGGPTSYTANDNQTSWDWDAGKKKYVEYSDQKPTGNEKTAQELQDMNK